MDIMQLLKMLGFPGQARAPNTIDLRNQWARYAAEAQMNGQAPVPFEQWAAQNHPTAQILNQGGLLNNPR